MNKSINYMSTSLMVKNQSKKQQHLSETSHSIDFHCLNEKLKKLQQQNEQQQSSPSYFESSEPTPSSHSPTKTNLKYSKPVINAPERDHRLRPPPKKPLPRSVSTLDKHNTIKTNHSFDSGSGRKPAERSQSQLIKQSNGIKNSQNNEVGPDEEAERINVKKPELIMSKSMRCSYSAKQNGSGSNKPVNLLRNSLNVNSSMKQMVSISRKMSESLRSDSSPSTSCDSSRSENLSFRSESPVSRSCSSR